MSKKFPTIEEMRNLTSECLKHADEVESNDDLDEWFSIGPDLELNIVGSCSEMTLYSVKDGAIKTLEPYCLIINDKPYPIIMFIDPK